MGEMGGVGIADIRRPMRKVDVLVGEMQQMPRPFPGPERAEGNAGLFLEQMQEARRGESCLRGAARRRHRLAGEFSDLQNRARHAGIEFARRQRFAKTKRIEFGAGERVAGVMFAQFAIGGANAAGESFAFRSRKTPFEVFRRTGWNTLRFVHAARYRTWVAGHGSTIAAIGGVATGEAVIPGWCVSTSPGISRFRVRCFASPRNDGVFKP